MRVNFPLSFAVSKQHKQRITVQGHIIATLYHLSDLHFLSTLIIQSTNKTSELNLILKKKKTMLTGY